MPPVPLGLQSTFNLLEEICLGSTWSFGEASGAEKGAGAVNRRGEREAEQTKKRCHETRQCSPNALILLTCAQVHMRILSMFSPSSLPHITLLTSQFHILLAGSPLLSCRIVIHNFNMATFR